MGSLFWGSGKETPGTEVEDDINSTSYSGAEYSWAPTEKMYGGLIFFCQSVWYNNKDDLSLGTKTCDVMVLDTLSGNIISAEFPDDYEEFFEANEFIDLN